ncbi:MAG: M20/M25/M40 family metallo-hydrolase [Anaerolineae bacterium]
MQTSLRREAIAFCRELVRLDSPSGHEAEVAARVQAEMTLLGFDTVIRDALGSVVGIVRGALPGRSVLFDAHLDVVPMDDPAAWRHPPLSAALADGRVWGRGTTDVKGSLSALVVAMGSLQRQKLAGTRIVSASVGEELMEGLALKEVLAGHPAERVVVCEPTGLRLGIGHKGRCGLVVEARGVAAHTSQPELGVNAIYRMLEALTLLRSIPPQQDSQLGSGVNELVEIASEPFPGSSVVPYGCTARFDRRLVRGETHASVLAESRAALAGLPEVTVRYHRSRLECYTGRTFEVDDFQPAWMEPPESPLVQDALHALAGAGQGAPLWLAPYCTNGAASAGALGLPTIVYGAGDIAQAHAADEYLEVEELAKAVEGYRALGYGLG